jgi:hypothetical protein
LHFEIHLLDPKRWWQGIAIDPYPVLVEAIECTLPSRLSVRNGHISAIPQTSGGDLQQVTNVSPTLPKGFRAT